MPQRFPILAVALLSIIASLPAVSRAQRSLDVAEARYQQASRETYIAQKAFDDAVARTREIGKAYQAALDEQRAANRLLADANVTGPKAAEKVRQAERALEAERERVAPQYAPVEAAANAHRAALDRALAPNADWVAVRERVNKAESAYKTAVDDKLAALAESDDAYLELLTESWDAEDAAIALRDTANVETQKLVDATNAWMAAIDALHRYEAEAVSADPAVRAADEALAREEDNGNAVRARLAKSVENDPDVASTAAALSAAENALWASGTNLRQLQADLDVQRTELARIDNIAASARERLAKVEPNLRGMAEELAKLDEAARRAQDGLAAAQEVEARTLAEREQLAADIAREMYVPPPDTVYVETPVYIDSGTTIYYPPVHRDKHHDHGRDYGHGGKDYGRDRYYGPDRDRSRDYGRDSDRNNGNSRDSDRNNGSSGGTRRDDGAGPARGRDYESTPRGVPSGGGDPPRTPVRQPDNKQPAPRPSGDDDATARRKQEEAKAAERQRREDAAAGAAKQQQQQQKKSNDDAAAQAAARQREESSRAAAQRQEESSRRQQQQSEAAARQRQQDQERKQRESSSSSGSSNSGSSSSSGDRGDRYRRK
jgi:hypothetical protein